MHKAHKSRLLVFVTFVIALVVGISLSSCLPRIKASKETIETNAAIILQHLEETERFGGSPYNEELADRAARGLGRGCDCLIVSISSEDYDSIILRFTIVDDKGRIYTMDIDSVGIIYGISGENGRAFYWELL